jgi:hypothetical protein
MTQKESEEKERKKCHQKAREKAKMKWQPAGLGRQGNLSESNAKPCCRSWKAADEAFAVADDGDGTG